MGLLVDVKGNVVIHLGIVNIKLAYLSGISFVENHIAMVLIFGSKGCSFWWASPLGLGFPVSPIDQGTCTYCPARFQGYSPLCWKVWCTFRH